MNRHYTAHDIIWIKNVNTPTEDAYMEVPVNFRLYFPDKDLTNPGKPKIGEIIILYQTINKQKVFTHLITPIDEVVGVDETRIRHKIYRNVKIIARTPPTRLINVENTLWRIVTFGGFGQGNVCKIRNISTVPNNYVGLLEDVWNRFIPFFREIDA